MVEEASFQAKPVPAKKMCDLPIEGLEKAVRVADSLSSDEKIKLQHFFGNHRHIFVWKTEDMIGISPEVAEHHLNINPEVRPIHQKRRHFSKEKWTSSKTK